MKAERDPPGEVDGGHRGALEVGRVDDDHVAGVSSGVMAKAPSKATPPAIPAHVTGDPPDRDRPRWIVGAGTATIV